MIKLMEICDMFVEFMKKYTEFTTLEFRVKEDDNSERDMLEVYYPLEENGGYKSEIKCSYYRGFSSETELGKNRYYLYIWSPKSNNLDKNEEVKMRVENIVEQFKQKGFQLKCSKYFCDCYYGILDKD